MQSERGLRGINPTFLVFLTAWIVFHFNLWIAFYFYPLSIAGYIALFFLQTLTIFVMFTPLHDAVHFSASKKRWLNEWMLHLTWPLFVNHPALFRKIHLSHHARTNQGTADPDHFTSAKFFHGEWSLAERWARSFLLIFYYYVYSLKNYGRKEYFWMAVSAVSMLTLIALSIFHPQAKGFMFVWLLPNITSIGLLAFANTSWPHYPGKEMSRYRNTRILYVPKLLQMVMLNQNLHLVHHLRPTIPWYDYPAYWRENMSEIIAAGGEVAHFHSIPPFENQKIEGKYVPSHVRGTFKESNTHSELI